ncbi:MAG: UDP-N-acetylmuramoyl-L-alanine--D-glutamate ligase [Planctomycetaceae bacterium]|nr:UDP-N-acetylmuramoyl-L-alanine--D-glutamate ligase [Planctomycetaceae bacterium]MCB9953899.1 UDP-N-acetylmuramoyl-L-alanine--D-glutamate ligase [Planctomycetaceae bacterium]
MDGPFLAPDSLRGRRVTVMGLGRFGGGVGVVNYLLRQGAVVTLTDQLPASELADSLARIDVGQLANLRLGGHDSLDFTSADLVVVNPAVKPEHPLLKLAADAGTHLTTELNLFWLAQRGHIVAVTGSVGKSTTTTLIAHILERTRDENGGTVRCGGNLGGSLLDVVEEIEPSDITVLEISSFQAERLGWVQARPDVVVVTNLFPNHLDWHGTVGEYFAAKSQLARYLTSEQALVFPEHDGNVAAWNAKGQRLRVSVSKDAVSIQTVGEARTICGALPEFPQLPGPHSAMNIALALTVCIDEFKRPLDECLDAIRSYETLPHRLQFIGEVQGRKFYNDSKATTPEAAMAALQTVMGPLHLIAGGADKGVDLTPFAQAIAQRVTSACFLGATGPALLTSANQCLPDGESKPIACANSLEEAFGLVWAQSQPGDTILLSPGCASFGEFRNYEERGAAFCGLVESLRCRATS